MGSPAAPPFVQLYPAGGIRLQLIQVKFDKSPAHVALVGNALLNAAGARSRVVAIGSAKQGSGDPGELPL